jgi:hypothetical protein
VGTVVLRGRSEGSQYEDRDAGFPYHNQQVSDHHDSGDPVVSGGHQEGTLGHVPEGGSPVG